MKTKNKRDYQLVLVLDPKITPKKGQVVRDRLKAEMDKMKGVKAAKGKHEGLKSLVYNIGGFDKGDFWTFDIDSQDGLKLDKLNVFLNRQKEVIRYLILKVF